MARRVNPTSAARISPRARIVLWLLLALPAALMLQGLLSHATLALDLERPSGEMAARLVVLALMPGPLIEVFGPSAFLLRWLAVRRNLGVAAFLHALLHLVFYWVDVGSLHALLDEIGLRGIWTGWLALALLAPPAATSFDFARKHLRGQWKRVQRLVYPAALLALAHWILLDVTWHSAALHAAPLLIAHGLRWHRRLRLIRRIPA